MVDEKKADEAAPQAAAAKRRGLPLDNKVVMLGVIVIVQALLAVGVTQFYIGPRLRAQAAAAQVGAATAITGDAASPRDGILVPMGEIIVTLQSGTEAPRFLKIALHLEVKNAKTADLATNRLAPLRDAAIMTLSAKTAEQMLSPVGKDEAREEILQRLREKLPAGSLLNVYISDLVIQ